MHSKREKMLSVVSKHKLDVNRILAYNVEEVAKFFCACVKDATLEYLNELAMDKNILFETDRDGRSIFFNCAQLCGERPFTGPINYFGILCEKYKITAEDIQHHPSSVFVRQCDRTAIVLDRILTKFPDIYSREELILEAIWCDVSVLHVIDKHMHITQDDISRDDWTLLRIDMTRSNVEIVKWLQEKGGCPLDHPIWLSLLDGSGPLADLYKDLLHAYQESMIKPDFVKFLKSSGERRKIYMEAAGLGSGGLLKWIWTNLPTTMVDAPIKDMLTTLVIKNYSLTLKVVLDFLPVEKEILFEGSPCIFYHALQWQDVLHTLVSRFEITEADLPSFHQLAGADVKKRRKNLLKTMSVSQDYFLSVTNYKQITTLCIADTTLLKAFINKAIETSDLYLLKHLASTFKITEDVDVNFVTSICRKAILDGGNLDHVREVCHLWQCNLTLDEDMCKTNPGEIEHLVTSLGLMILNYKHDNLKAMVEYGTVKDVEFYLKHVSFAEEDKSFISQLLTKSKSWDMTQVLCSHFRITQKEFADMAVSLYFSQLEGYKASDQAVDVASIKNIFDTMSLKKNLTADDLDTIQLFSVHLKQPQLLHMFLEAYCRRHLCESM